MHCFGQDSTEQDPTVGQSAARYGLGFDTESRPVERGISGHIVFVPSTDTAGGAQETVELSS